MAIITEKIDNWTWYTLYYMKLTEVFCAKFNLNQIKLLDEDQMTLLKHIHRTEKQVTPQGKTESAR